MLSKRQIYLLANAGRKISEKFTDLKANDDPEDIKEKIELGDILYRHLDPYFSDSYYDSLYEKYIKLIEEGVLDDEVIDEVICYDDSGDFKLPYRTKSIKKLTLDEIEKWLIKLKAQCNKLDIPPENIVIDISPKLDGYSIHSYGRAMFTRGDGEYGKLVSYLDVLNTTNISSPGELIVRKSYYDKYLKDKYKSPLTFLSSILNLKTTLSIDAIRAINTGGVQWISFEELDSEIELLASITKEKIKFYLDNLANEIVPDYETDGIVISVRNEKLQKVLGGSKKYDNWVCCLKPEVPSEYTRIEGFTFNHHISGHMVPTVLLENVQLGFKTVNKINGHSLKYLLENKLKVGERIKVKLTGGTVPTLEKTTTALFKAKTILTYKELLQYLGLEKITCPCGNGTDFKILKEKIYCNNLQCTSKLKAIYVYIAKELRYKNFIFNSWYKVLKDEYSPNEYLKEETMRHFILKHLKKDPNNFNFNKLRGHIRNG